MRVFWGIVLGIELFFPGIVLVQWVGEDLLGYKEMSVTDGCLVMIIILLSVIIVTGISRRQQYQPSQRQPSTPGSETEPYPQQPPSRGVRRPLGRTSSSRRSQRE